MLIRYCFRTEKQKLPEAEILFEAVRNMHADFIQDPVKFNGKYNQWLRPMNQLIPGHFISINYDAPDFPFYKFKYQIESDIKLEMMYIDKNFVRIQFHLENPFPYRIYTGNLNSNISTIQPFLSGRFPNAE